MFLPTIYCRYHKHHHYNAAAAITTTTITDHGQHQNEETKEQHA